MNWNKIVECVPNFSEGRDLEKIDRIVAPFRARSGVKLLDYSNDEDHNRLVVTLIGEPEALRDAVIFLYEKSATAPHRENLAAVRKGEFEGMAEKMKLPEWHPDYGPAGCHPTAGVVAIGARMPLVAYNINLSTDNLEIATKIAKNIRHINGGLRYVKAMGVELKERNITQVSINITDYTRTALYRAFELVRIEARRYGVTILGSEIVGLVPMEALIDTASYYLGLENFSMRQVLESRIME